MELRTVDWLTADFNPHDIYGHAQFRLNLTGQALRARIEEVYVARHRACISEQRATLVGQHRITTAAIEQPGPELPL
jgi:hypothetical protein